MAKTSRTTSTISNRTAMTAMGTMIAATGVGVGIARGVGIAEEAR